MAENTLRITSLSQDREDTTIILGGTDQVQHRHSMTL
jgi:hypothetical protein